MLPDASSRTRQPLSGTVLPTGTGRPSTGRPPTTTWPEGKSASAIVRPVPSGEQGPAGMVANTLVSWPLSAIWVRVVPWPTQGAIRLLDLKMCYSTSRIHTATGMPLG